MNKKLMILIFVSSMVALISLGGGLALANTIYVDDDNCPGPGTGILSDPFCIIQDAVDVAAPGDTIFVHNGTYSATTSPFVRITTDSLTLMGESRDGVVLDGTGTSTISWAKGIHVTANNVTINDLTVQYFGAVGYWGYGVLFRDYAHDTPGEGYIYYTGGVVENVTSQNNYYPMYALVSVHPRMDKYLILGHKMPKKSHFKVVLFP